MEIMLWRDLAIMEIDSESLDVLLYKLIQPLCGLGEDSWVILTDTKYDQSTAVHYIEFLIIIFNRIFVSII